jgi:hypothetical protein
VDTDIPHTTARSGDGGCRKYGIPAARTARGPGRVMIAGRALPRPKLSPGQLEPGLVSGLGTR